MTLALCTVESAFAQTAYGGTAPALPGGTGGTSAYGGTPGIPGGTTAAASREAAARTAGWHLVPELGAELDFTDNVDLAPSGQRRSDFVTQITPRLTVFEKSAHTTFSGSIAAPAFLYARTGGDNNKVSPEVNLVGNAELVPRLFFIDGSVQVSQQYFSPFGARPQSLVNATNNRYTAQSYRVSPYLKGEARDGLKYELRDNNTWSTASSAPVATNNSYTNEIVGNVTQDPRPFGWAVDYNRSDTKFSGQEPLRDELGRGRALWRPDPQLELSASAGYEDTRYPFLATSGAIYGTGFRWHPTQRTNVEANWEHRFFGSSYHVVFDHKTPLSVWTLRASRDITTYPQQLASLAAGANVASLLDQLFASRITDIALRQSVVDQLIRDRGLPAELASPLTLYTQQVTLQESVQATVALLGARNAVFITARRTRSEPVTKDVLVPVDILSLQNDNTQTGANVVWTYKLTPLYTLSTVGDWLRTVPNGDSGLRSTQRSLRVVLSAPLSPLTDVYVGARHQVLDSDIENSYRESAAFVGIRHFFH